MLMTVLGSREKKKKSEREREKGSRIDTKKMILYLRTQTLLFAVFV